MGFKLKNINTINGVATPHGSGTEHGIKAVTDCKMITVGCTV
jgi:hypothetical protein